MCRREGKCCGRLTKEFPLASRPDHRLPSLPVPRNLAELVLKGSNAIPVPISWRII